MVDGIYLIHFELYRSIHFDGVCIIYIHNYPILMASFQGRSDENSDVASFFAFTNPKCTCQQDLGNGLCAHV